MLPCLVGNAVLWGSSIYGPPTVAVRFNVGAGSSVASGPNAKSLAAPLDGSALASVVPPRSLPVSATGDVGGRFRLHGSSPPKRSATCARPVRSRLRPQYARSGRTVERSCRWGSEERDSALWGSCQPRRFLQSSPGRFSHHAFQGPPSRPSCPSVSSSIPQWPQMKSRQMTVGVRSVMLLPPKDEEERAVRGLLGRPVRVQPVERWDKPDFDFWRHDVADVA